MIYDYGERIDPTPLPTDKADKGRLYGVELEVEYPRDGCRERDRYPPDCECTDDELDEHGCTCDRSEWMARQGDGCCAMGLDWPTLTATS